MNENSENSTAKENWSVSIPKHSKVDGIVYIKKLLKEWKEYCSQSFYLLLYNLAEERYIVVCIPDDPDERSLYRMTRKLKFNAGLFNFFITLTFPDTSNGVYMNGIEYRDKMTLSDIRYSGFSKYLRVFFNRLQQICRNNGYHINDYFWKYEQGAKTNRPHIHVFFGSHTYEVSWFDNIPPKFTQSAFGTILEGGYIPAVPLRLHEELMQCWNSGLIEISPLNRRGVMSYLDKYFSKHGACNKRGRSRRWGCSRSIRKPSKNPNYIYIEQSRDMDYLYQISENLDFTSYLPTEYCILDNL